MFRFRWVSRPTIGCYWVSASATLSTTPLFVSVRNQYPTEPLLLSSSVVLFSRKRSCGPFLWLGLSLAAGLLPGLQTDGLPIEGVFVCSGWAAPRSFEQRSEPCAPPPHHRPAHCRESLRPAHPRTFGARPGPGGVVQPRRLSSSSARLLSIGPIARWVIGFPPTTCRTRSAQKFRWTRRWSETT